MIGRELGIPRGSSNTSVIPTLDEMCIRSIAEKDQNSGRTLHLSMYSLWTRPQERPFGKSPVWRIHYPWELLPGAPTYSVHTQANSIFCLAFENISPELLHLGQKLAQYKLSAWYFVIIFYVLIFTCLLRGRQVNINAKTLAVISTHSMQSVSISITVLTMQKWRVSIKGFGMRFWKITCNWGWSKVNDIALYTLVV